jgi:hypothetical protein
VTRPDVPAALRRSVDALPPDMRRTVLAAIEAGYPSDVEVREQEAERQRQLRRERAERLRSIAVAVVQALDQAPRPLPAQLEEVVHHIGAAVSTLAAWSPASGRKLTPVELHALQQALRSPLVDRQLDRAAQLLRADAANRPALLFQWREADALEVPR